VKRAAPGRHERTVVIVVACAALLPVSARAAPGTGLPSSFEQAGQGGPRLALTRPDGAIIIVDGYDDGRTIALSSFSSCVTDLADYDGGYSY